MSEQEFHKLVDVLSKLQRPAIPLDVDLWDADMIGHYLKRTPRQVISRYAPLPSFPKPIRLPSTGAGLGRPLWKAKEIIEWAEKYQEKAKAA